MYLQHISSVVATNNQPCPTMTTKHGHICFSSVQWDSIGRERAKTKCLSSNVALTLTSAVYFVDVMWLTLTSVCFSVLLLFIVKWINKWCDVNFFYCTTTRRQRNIFTMVVSSLMYYLFDVDVCQVFGRGTKTRMFLAKVRLVFLHSCARVKA